MQIQTSNNKRILVISDLHIPYEHPDSLPFLKALKKHIDPTRVISVGDELDKHALSYHDNNPDLPSAGDELEMSIKRLQSYYKLFPKMDIVESNHGSMIYRKALTHGLPKAYVKDYNDVLDAPKGWKWHENLMLQHKDDAPIFITHGMSANIMKLVEQYGMNCVQGHYHSTFSIGFMSNPTNLLWGLQVGCLVDQKSLAFAYSKLFRKRFIIGCGAIIDGQPRLFPMQLNKEGRWTGKIV
jgi:predicted phosphodiesterase